MNRLTVVSLLVGVLLSGQSFAQDTAQPTTTKEPTTTENLKVDDTSEYLKYNVAMEQTDSRFTIGLYTAIAQFARQGVNLLGYTIEVDANYALTSKLGTQLSISQAVSAEGGVSVLFTGIRLAGSYCILGDFIKKQSTVVVNGQSTYSQVSGDDSVLAGEVGVEQYLFNGNDRIVPGTGISFGARYDRQIWGFRGSLLARYGALLISQESVQMITLGAGLMLQF